MVLPHACNRSDMCCVQDGRVLVQRYFWLKETCIGPPDAQMNGLVQRDEQRVFLAMLPDGQPHTLEVRRGNIAK